jgi:hypothetical protein
MITFRVTLSDDAMKIICRETSCKEAGPALENLLIDKIENDVDYYCTKFDVEVEEIGRK